jgi:hypothetical protein
MATVTYDGTTDRSQNPSTEVIVGDYVFPLDKQVKDVPDEVVKQLDGLTYHKFTVKADRGQKKED